MSDEAESVRALLTTVAERGAGERLVPPVAELIGRARRARRRRRAFSFAAVLAVAAAIALPQAIPDRAPAEQPWPGYPATGPGTAAALAAGHWTRLPEAPIPGRTGAAVVWTGSEMLVWGGRVGDSARSDGAAYRPADRRWTVLPEAPLTPRTQMAYAWTGTVLFVWSESDGAVYDPVARSWRLVPTSPLSWRTGPTAVWTGRDVLVIGGWTDDGRPLADGAAYDPATARWRPLPALPVASDHPVTRLVPLAASDQVYVWATWAHRVNTSENSFETTFGMDLFRLDTRTDTWSTPVASGEAPTGVDQPVWTGHEIVVPAAMPYRPGSGPVGVGLRGGRLDPAGGLWRPITHGPVDDLRGQSVWTGAALVSFGNGAGAAWDPTTDLWKGSVGADHRELRDGLDGHAPADLGRADRGRQLRKLTVLTVGAPPVRRLVFRILRDPERVSPPRRPSSGGRGLSRSPVRSSGPST